MLINNTLCDKYGDFIIKKKEEFGDLQTIYRFWNGYGASVINSMYSRGLELAVLVFDGDNIEISYSTPITNDVIGYIPGNKELEELLDKVYELKGRELA